MRDGADTEDGVRESAGTERENIDEVKKEDGVACGGEMEFGVG